MVPCIPSTPLARIILACFFGHGDEYTLLVPPTPLLHEAPHSLHPWHRDWPVPVYDFPPRACRTGSRRWYPGH
jgi:hypothetical protein